MKTGPTAFLALFAPEECRDLALTCCGKRRCPCDDARRWLRSLPPSIPFARIWHECERQDWKRWVAEIARVAPDAPWPTVALGLARRSKEPVSEMEKCGHCDKELDPEELERGYCSDCFHEHYVYCQICQYVDRESNTPCGHLIWSDHCGEFIGAGSDYKPDEKSLHNVCVALGLRLTERLRAAIARPGKWQYLEKDRRDGENLDELIKDMREAARDDDDRDDREDGAIWFRTLASRTTEANATTITWLDAHIAARNAAITKDRRPRRVIRDGQGRYWIDGEWTPLRPKARWMKAKRAEKVRGILSQEYPGSGCRVVHVLTPAPAFVERRGAR